MSNEPLSHNAFLMIPALVANHPDLDADTCMLFGRLNALSNQKGYCFASDEYLAEISKCGDRVITNRLLKLKNLDFIRVVTVKKGMFYDRKIFTCNNYRSMNDDIIQKSFTKGTHVPSRRAPACPLVGHTRAPYIDKSNINKKEYINTCSEPEIRAPEQQSLDVFFSISSGKFENITPDDMSSWRTAFPSIDLDQQISQAQEWLKSNTTKAKLKKKWRKFLTNWFTRAEEKEVNKTAYKSSNHKYQTFGKVSPEQEQENIQFMQQMLKENPQLKNGDYMDFGRNYVRFVNSGQGAEKFLNCSDNGFQEKLRNSIGKHEEFDEDQFNKKFDKLWGKSV